MTDKKQWRLRNSKKSSRLIFWNCSTCSPRPPVHRAACWLPQCYFIWFRACICKVWLNFVKVFDGLIEVCLWCGVWLRSLFCLPWRAQSSKAPVTAFLCSHVMICMRSSKSFGQFGKFFPSKHLCECSLFSLFSTSPHQLKKSSQNSSKLGEHDLLHTNKQWFKPQYRRLLDSRDRPMPTNNREKKSIESSR